MRKTSVFLVIAAALFITSGCERPDDTSEGETVEEKGALASDDSRAEVSEEPWEIPYPSNEWECTDDDAEAIAAWLDSASRWPPEGFYFRQVDDLPRLEGSTMESPDVELIVERDGYYLDDRPIEDRMEFRDRLDETAGRLRSQAEMIDDDTPHVIAVAVHTDVPAARLLHSLRVVRAVGFDASYFVFSSPPEQQDFEPIPERIVERLEPLFAAGAPKDRQELRIGGETRHPVIDAIGEECPSIVEVEDFLETRQPEQRGRLMRETLARALVDCNCDTDVEFVVALQAWRVGIYRDPNSWMHATAVEFSPDEILEFLDGRGDQRWGELADEFVTAR